VIVEMLLSCWTWPLAAALGLVSEVRVASAISFACFFFAVIDTPLARLCHRLCARILGKRTVTIASCC
jgi:hypothetical protein